MTRRYVRNVLVNRASDVAMCLRLTGTFATYLVRVHISYVKDTNIIDAFLRCM